MNLISYAVMRVNLAAQALIDPVGNVSNRFGPEEAEGTGQFFIMDKLIECLKRKGTYLKNHSYNHMNQLMILDLHGWMNFCSILNHGKSQLKHEMILIIQKMLNLKGLFHGKDMRAYKLMFYPSKKSVNFCYSNLSLIFFIMVLSG